MLDDEFPWDLSPVGKIMLALGREALPTFFLDTSPVLVPSFIFLPSRSSAAMLSASRANLLDRLRFFGYAHPAGPHPPLSAYLSAITGAADQRATIPISEAPEMPEVEATRRRFLKHVGLGGAACFLPIGSAHADDVDAAPQKRVGIKEFAQNAQALADLRTAVKKMRDLAPRHPFSWTFQANIHWRPFFPDYVYQQADESTDPAQQLFRDTTGFSPSADVFNKCPHANWWFLPWHRAYLYFFERILRWASGNAKFSLPYWNYCDAAERELPKALPRPDHGRQGQWPAQPAVPTRDRDVRGPRRQSAGVSTPRQRFELRASPNSHHSWPRLDALKVVPFTNASPAGPRDSFGGPRACDAMCGCGSGALEAHPAQPGPQRHRRQRRPGRRRLRVGIHGRRNHRRPRPDLLATSCQHRPVLGVLGRAERWPRKPAGRRMARRRVHLLRRRRRKVSRNLQSLRRGSCSAPRTSATTTTSWSFCRSAAPAAVLAVTGQSVRTLAATAVLPAPKIGVREMPHMLDAGIQLSNTKVRSVAVPLRQNFAPDAFRAALATKADASGELFVAVQGIEFLYQPGVYYDVFLGLPKNEAPTPASSHYVGSISLFGVGHAGPPGRGGADHVHPTRFSIRLRVLEALRNQLQGEKVDPTKLEVTFVPQSGTEPVNKERKLPEPKERTDCADSTKG